MHGLATTWFLTGIDCVCKLLEQSKMFKSQNKHNLVTSCKNHTISPFAQHREPGGTDSLDIWLEMYEQNKPNALSVINHR